VRHQSARAQAECRDQGDQQRIAELDREQKRDGDRKPPSDRVGQSRSKYSRTGTQIAEVVSGDREFEAIEEPLTRAVERQGDERRSDTVLRISTTIASPNGKGDVLARRSGRDGNLPRSQIDSVTWYIRMSSPKTNTPRLVPA
jgi:hypothetical protein